MQIKLTPIKVKDVFDQFVDNGEDGVFGYKWSKDTAKCTLVNAV